jgi:transcriptional regulator with XRE-family HTH domain
MTASEYLEALQSLGWKQSDLCRRVDVSKNTASRWGQDGPPRWVGEYLRVMMELDRLHRLYVRPPKIEKNEPDDGDDAPSPNGRAARLAKRLTADSAPDGGKE